MQKPTFAFSRKTAALRFSSLISCSEYMRQQIAPASFAYAEAFDRTNGVL